MNIENRVEELLLTCIVLHMGEQLLPKDIDLYNKQRNKVESYKDCSSYK